MTKLYDGDTFTYDGMSFRVNFPYDDMQRLPWEDCDCHGPVSEWTRRAKLPGELVLCGDNGYHRFYDFQGACRIARDVWGLPTKEKAAEAARKDYEYLRRFCNDQWSYVGVVVTLLDDDGDALEDYTDSLWGIESDATEALEEVAHELAEQIVTTAQKELTQ